jgi:uncharacterized repeat protein (TIGR03803 family)
LKNHQTVVEKAQSLASTFVSIHACLARGLITSLLSLAAVTGVEASAVADDPPFFQVLKEFDSGTTGAYLYAGLIQATDGALYGTASSGGSSDYGTVFRLNADGSGFTVLQNLDLSTTGGVPYGSLVQGVDGALYGTATEGGTHGYGTVFKLNTDGTGFTVLLNFDNATTGSKPFAGLLQATDGALYGTAREGGSNGHGTLFRLNPDGTGFSVLMHFDEYITGRKPYAGLIQGADGALYGTADNGGGHGTVFKLNTDGTGFRVLKSLSDATGRIPGGALIQGTDGAIYGTASEGGALIWGTVFKLNPDGTGFKVLKHFDDGESCSPFSSLTQGPDGVLYGTARSCVSGDGTVFKLNTDGRGFAVLADLDDATTGGVPLAGLIQGTDGALYGTASQGGSGAGGTVFRLATVGMGLPATVPGAPEMGAATAGNGVVLVSFSSPLNNGGSLITGYTVACGAYVASGASSPISLMVPNGTMVSCTVRATNAVGSGAWSSPSNSVSPAVAPGAPTIGTATAGVGSISVTFTPPGSDGGSPISFYMAICGARSNAGASSPIVVSGFEGGVPVTCTVVATNHAGTGPPSESSNTATPSVAPSVPGIFQVLKAFEGHGPLGWDVRAGLLQGADGALYGAAQGGGHLGYGTLFRLNPDGTGFSVLKHLDNATTGGYPSASLIQGRDGALYGTAREGGMNDCGTVFRLNADGTGYTVLKHLDYAACRTEAGLTQGMDGALYGTAGSMEVFKLNTDGTDFTVLKHLQNGGESTATLLQGPDGALYGTATGGEYPASGNGMVFKLNTDGTGFNVLHDFDDRATMGLRPLAGLTRGTDGALYGMTAADGSGEFGTVFKLNADGTGFRLLHSFDGATTGGYPHSPLILGTDGALYGTARDGGSSDDGTVFKLNPDGTGFSVLLNLESPTTGAHPMAGLLQGRDGALYGTAFSGGHGYGTVFKLNADGTGFSMLKNLHYPAAGAFPTAGLFQGADGVLYGTANGGGASRGEGTVFKLNPDGTGFSVLKDFEALTTGGYPYAGLIQGTDGFLYGTSVLGGANGHGTVFRLAVDGSGFIVLKTFDHSTTGGTLYAGLIQGTDGALYGTASEGGTSNHGTVFKLNTDGSGFAVLKHLDSSTGGNPWGRLVQGMDGAFYGTTRNGGSHGGGTAFKLNADGTGFIVLKNFDSSTTGAGPSAGLIQGMDGALYGTALAGGTSNRGTVFKLNPDGTGFNVLHNFDYAVTGAHPVAALIQGADGGLYGTAREGGSGGYGTVFMLNPDGTGFSVLKNFDNATTGGKPHAPLIRGADGALYGTTTEGGSDGGGTGTVFRLATVPDAPFGLSAVAGDTQATVSFSAPSGNGGSAITAYTVKSWPAGGVVSAAGSTSLSHVVTGLANGTSYTFTVHATNAVGDGPESAASNSVIPTIPASVPDAPTIGTATSGNASVSVAFTAPPSDGGSAITGYTATCGTQSNSSVSSPIVVSGLTNGVAVTCTVLATNGVGNGPPSAASSSVTPATVPGAPTIGTATAGNSSVSVTFTPPGSNGGSAITGYTATCGTQSNSGAASPIVVSGLTNGVPVNCTVLSTNGVGNGSPSAASDSVTPATVPGAPTIETATAGNASVSVSFTAPGDHGGSPITGYLATCDAQSNSGTSSPIVVRGLMNGAAVTCTVRATNSVGNGPSSAASDSVTPATVPEAPTIGAATAGNASVSVTFTAPARDGGSPITGYTATCGSQSGLGATSPIVVTGLANGVAVTCEVIATNSVGGGPPSAPSNSVTPATVPGAPTIGATTAGNASVSVSFTAPGDDGGSPITGYLATCDALSNSAASSPIVVTGLTNGVPVTCTVLATNSVGNGPSSGVSDRVTPATVPEAPTIGAATAGNASVSVSFTAPGDDGGSPITGYTATCGTQSNSGSSSPILVSGLTNGVAVTCTVLATSSVGDSAASGASNSVTPATVPGSPTIGTGTVGDALVSVTFTAPSSNGGSMITGYTATCGTQSKSGPSSPILVSGLTNGVAVTCTVLATNGAGNGLPSAASSSVTPVAGAVHPPVLQVLKAFDYSTTGSYLSAGLVQATDGALYGTASYGGSSDYGTVFRLNSDGSGFTVLQNLDLSTTGGSPYGSLVQGADGALYGTATEGGAHGYGTVFKLNTDGTGFTVLLDFDNATTGGKPFAGLLQATDGALYGTAREGGSSGYGTVFKLDPDGTGFSVLKHFDNSTTGRNPYAGLIQGADGALYGTTENGSPSSGTVFKLNPDGTGFRVLKNLSDATGRIPGGALIQGTDGAIYGTASDGGIFALGTVFKLNPDGTGFKVLKHFEEGESCRPFSSLTQGPDGVLYGTAPHCVSGYGTVFKLNTDGRGFAVRADLDDATTGGVPLAGLIQGTDGALYGTASQGGSGGGGTVFRLATAGMGLPATVPGAPEMGAATAGNGVVLVSFSSPTNNGGSLITGYTVACGAYVASGTSSPISLMVPNGTTVSCTVRATNAVGPGAWSSPSNSVSPAVAPGAPTIGAATAGVGAVSVTFTPPASDGGSAITFYMAICGARSNAGASSPILVSGFEGGVPVTCTVVATNHAGTGPPSESSNSATPSVAPSVPGVFQVLKAFEGRYLREVRAGLIQGADGALYGTALADGQNGYGGVFRLNPDGTGFSVLKYMDNATTGGYPSASLIQGSDGALYGTAREGGSNDCGTVFRLNADGTGFTVLKHLDYAACRTEAGLTQGMDGALYGTAGSMEVFKLNTDGTDFTVLKHLQNGGESTATLLQGPDGALYGTATGGEYPASGNGMVFKLNTDGTGFNVLHDFDDRATMGLRPLAGLTRGTDGALYGMTAADGSGEFGTVFKLNADGTGFRLLHSFDGATTGGYPHSPLILGTDGALYGTARDGGSSDDGTVFKLNPDGTGFSVLLNLESPTTGAHPMAGLLQGRDGALYGTAFDGGRGFGTVFKLNSDGTAFSMLENFHYAIAGAFPEAGLLQGTDGGTLYGAAPSGGTVGYGTLFKLNADGTGFSVFQNFDLSTTGGGSSASLIKGTDGALYGTGRSGAGGTRGTVFKVNADGTGFTVLKEFDHSTTGGTLYAGLIQGTDGALYGTASEGGTSNHGTVFKLNTDGSGFAVLKHLDSSTGGNPWGRLVQGMDGAFYGTTRNGGSHGGGTAFKLNADGTGFIVLKDFDRATAGASPSAALIQGIDGALYGTALAGGSSNRGTVFKLNPDGTGFSVLHNFDYAVTGAYPRAALIQGADRALYGTARDGGSAGSGTVFKLNPDGTGFSVLKNFDNETTGGKSHAPLIRGADGALYGTTNEGGRNSGGTVFRLATVPDAPFGLSAVAGDTQANVSFSAPSGNGGSAITAYTVRSWPAGAVDSAAGSTSLSHVVTGLANGTSYTFTVHATNAVGDGPESAASNSVIPTIPATVPDAPTIGTATSGNASVSVAFTAPASDGGSVITGYTATCGTQSNSSASSPIVVSGLTNGVAVTCTVLATNGVGNSAPSATSNSVTPATVPGAPTIGTATAGNASVSVAFTPPASNGGSAIAGYTATCGTESNSGTSSPIVVSGLANGVAVTCTVLATNGAGNSAPSSASNSVTPFAPTVSINEVSITEGNAGTVIASFTVSLSAASGQTVTVSAATSNGRATAGSDYLAAGPATLTFNPGDTTKTFSVTVSGDTADEPNETFTVTLSGATNATISDGTGLGTILDDDVVPAVSIGTATLITKTSAKLNATVNPNGSATTAHFQYGATNAYGLTTPTETLGSGVSALGLDLGAVTGLACGTTYHFRAVATSAVGPTNGADATFTTTACGPAISLFTASPVLVNSGGSSLLSWSVEPGATLTLNGSPIAGPTGSQTVNPVATTAYALAGTDSSGTSTRSVTVVVNDGSAGLGTPTITAPTASQTVIVTGVGFTWTAVASATAYDIRVFNGTTGALLFSGSLQGAGSTSTLVTLDSGSYRFAVRACAGGLASTQCGSYASVAFSVSPAAPSGAPTVTFPAAGANLTQSTQTLAWTSVTPNPLLSGLTYELLLSNLTNGTTALQITVPSPATSTIFTMPGAQYELKVRACQAACGPWSTPVNFSVTLPSIPASAPVISSCTISGGNSLTCNWGSVANADTYQVLVVQPPPAGPGGGALTAAAVQVSATTVTLPVPPGPATVLISACNGDGCGPYATTPIDVAGLNPAAPNLGTPMAGTVVSGPTVLFTWNRIPGDNGSNTTYRLFVQDLSRQQTALDIYTTSNFYGAYFKAEGARYDALVIANPGPSQIVGPAQGFNVAGLSATAPTMVSPAHNSTVPSGNVQLGWSPVPGATLYEYFVAVLGQPDATARGVTPGLLTQVPLTGTGLGTVYSGIVRACPLGATCVAGIDSGWGPWSNAGGPGVTNFTVIP